MSEPNTNNEPESAPLSEDSLTAMVTAAQSAFGAAESVAALKSARGAHLAEKSPIALANREIGALPVVLGESFEGDRLPLGFGDHGCSWGLVSR